MSSVPTFIPNCAHDVFVSFAQEDDSQDGWVTSLIDLLGKRLDRFLDESPFSLWTDRQLAADCQLTGELVAKLEKTPVFIIVLSPGYLKSDWCASGDGLASELPTFLKLVDERLQTEKFRSWSRR